MTRFRFTTRPTGAKKGAWRETRLEAMRDAVEAGCGEHDDEALGGVRLDLMVAIEEEGRPL